MSKMSKGKKKGLWHLCGRFWTLEDIVAESQVTTSTAWYRVQTILKDPDNPKYTEEWLLRPPSLHAASKYKVYEVEGQQITALDVVDKIKCSIQNAKYRLNKFKTLDEIFAPTRTDHARANCVCTNYTKMIDDDMFKLIMRSIA